MTKRFEYFKNLANFFIKAGLQNAVKFIFSDRIYINKHVIHLRRQTTDFIVYNQVFISQNYNIKNIVDKHFKNKELKVFDLGANVGFFTLKVFDEHRIKKLYAFNILFI